jgi:hypothetical protein
LCFAFIFTALANNFLSRTTPWRWRFNEASLHHLLYHRRLHEFFSGVGSDSPFFWVFFKKSPGFTSAPILIIPFSSKSLVASSETLEYHSVTSLPNLYLYLMNNQREVKNIVTNYFSEITIASSKLAFPWHKRHFQVTT